MENQGHSCVCSTTADWVHRKGGCLHKRELSASRNLYDKHFLNIQQQRLSSLSYKFKVNS